jgi:mono/diheme cytochrome c family protein
MTAMRPMTRITTLFATATLIAATAGFSVAGYFEPRDPVARGRYLVTAMGCNDCHTPWQMTSDGPAPDMSRMLSGHPADFAVPAAPTPSAAWPVAVAATNTAWSGPWGTSFTANLTPDAETGLGRWTADEFVAALRTGRHQGRGRQILPPMPYPMIRQLSDDDLKAVFAWLQSIPAVRNKVPEPLPPGQ